MKKVTTHKLNEKVKENTKPEKKELRKLTLEENKVYSMLKIWRHQKSKEMRIPPYTIFSNDSLKEITISKINDLNSLKKIKGIADKKINTFGKEILEILKETDKYDLVEIVNVFVQYDKYEGYDRVKVRYISNGDEEWLDTTQELPEKNKLVAVKINKNWFNDYCYIDKED